MTYKKYRLKNNVLAKRSTSIIADKLASVVGKTRRPPPLSRIHEFLSGSDLNDFRVACFDSLNLEPWVEWFLADCSEIIYSSLGPDFCIQSKVNLSIVPPGDLSSQLPIHSDSWSGDSPFQLNFWFPLTHALGDSGIYIVDAQRSLKAMQSLQQNGRLPVIQSRFRIAVSARIGNVIVFNPALLHGSGVNTANLTRVSLNIRVKNFFAPDFSAQYPDRSSSAYFNHTVLSESAKFGIRFWKSCRLTSKDLNP